MVRVEEGEGGGRASSPISNMDRIGDRGVKGDGERLSIALGALDRGAAA